MAHHRAMSSAPAVAAPDHELRRAVRLLLRDLHAPGLIPHRATELLDEAHALLIELTAEDTLHLRIRFDGVYRGEERLLSIRAERNARAFRIFQHGVRQISFSPGVERSELADLVSVIATDWTQAMHREDDIVTLVGGMQLDSVHLVVVETFSESGDGEDGDLAAIVASGLRGTVDATDEPENAHETVIRFSNADVERVDLAMAEQVASALSRAHPAAASPVQIDPSTDALRAELEDGVRHVGRWLVAPAMKMAPLCDATERDRLREILTHQLLAEANLTASPTEALSSLLDAREAARLPGTSPTLIDDLLDPALEKIALAALGAPGQASMDAIDVLVGAAHGDDAEVARRVARLPPSAVRDAALTTVAERSGGRLVAFAREALPALDAAAVDALLHGLRHVPLASDSLALFRAALSSEHATVRARGLGWLNFQAPDHAVKELGKALRVGDRVLWQSALCLVLRSRPIVARALITSWYGSDECQSLALEDRRLAVLAYVKLIGNRALSELRKTAHGSAFRRRTKEARAVAVVGLGVLRDAESRPLIESLAAKRSSGDLACREAGRIVDAARAGQRPYLDPLVLVEDELSCLGVLEVLRVSEQDLGPAVDDGVSDGFSVRSKSLSEHPSNRPPKHASDIEAFSVRSSSLSSAPARLPPEGLRERHAEAQLSAVSADVAPMLESELPLPDLDLISPPSDALKAPRAPADLVSLFEPSDPDPEPDVLTNAPSRSVTRRRPLSSPSAPVTKPKFRPPSVAGAKRPARVRPPARRSPLLRTAPTQEKSKTESDIEELEALFEQFESELPERGEEHG